MSVGEDVERDLLPNRNVKVTFNTAELPPSPIGPLFRGYALLATGHFESDVGAFSDVGSPEQLAKFLADHGPITEGPMPDFPDYRSGH